MKSSQHNIEQPPETVRTLAEWKKPLLVTFVFLAFITIGFVSYTCVYFNRLNQPINNDEALSNEELDCAIHVVDTGTIEDRDSHKDRPCKDDSYRSWATYNISEINLMYRLHPDVTYFYLNRLQGPDLFVDAFACNELKDFGQELFFKIFKELQTTFGSHQAKELMHRISCMMNSNSIYNRDDVWTWTDSIDFQIYFVSLKDSVLSYVTSGPQITVGIPKEELLNTRSIQFECPGVWTADLRTEMGWTAVGPTTYPEKDAENLLEISAAFESSNVWRTLADDCIAKYVNAIKNLGIKSYCDSSKRQVNYTNDTCVKIWEWSKAKPIGFKIWKEEKHPWTLAYRYDDPKESDKI